MKTILCFGDSNTYGYRPEDGKRFSAQIRWPGILRQLFATDFEKKEIAEQVEIVEEGLVGRTTVFEDSFRPGRKGIDYLVPLLESHGPIDRLILMLGTNDCKTIYNTTAEVIGLGMEQLIKKVKAYDPFLEIVLISPIHLGKEVWKDGFDPEFSEESVSVSKGLQAVYEKLAEKYGCSFFAASQVAEPSEVDQEHLDSAGHKALAEALHTLIKERIEE